MTNTLEVEFLAHFKYSYCPNKQLRTGELDWLKDLDDMMYLDPMEALVETAFEYPVHPDPDPHQNDASSTITSSSCSDYSCDDLSVDDASGASDADSTEECEDQSCDKPLPDVPIDCGTSLWNHSFYEADDEDEDDSSIDEASELYTPTEYTPTEYTSYTVDSDVHSLDERRYVRRALPKVARHETWSCPAQPGIVPQKKIFGHSAAAIELITRGLPFWRGHSF